MTILNGTNYGKSLNPTSENVASPGTLGGRVRILTESVICDAAQPEDSFRLGRKLRKGAKILRLECLFVDALGIGVLVDVGDAVDQYRYHTNVDGNQPDNFVGRMHTTAAHYEIGTNDGDDVIMAKIIDAEANGEVKFNIFYTED